MNTTDVNFALYSQQTLDAEDRAFVLKIQDTVRAAVDEARFSTGSGADAGKQAGAAQKLEEIGYSVMTMSPALFRQMNRTELLAA